MSVIFIFSKTKSCFSAVPLGPGGSGGSRRSSGTGSPGRSPMEEEVRKAAAPDARTSHWTATKAVAARALEGVAHAACMGV